MRTLIAIATYNERDNLPTLIDAILEAAADADILVIDDHSPDGTADWVAQRQQTEKHLRLIVREGKLGLGTAVIAGMNDAIENQYDYFVNLDADWSHSPASIPQLIARMTPDCDVVIGSRYVQGGKIEGWPLYRKMMSRAVNWFARWMLRLPTRDNSGAFRCYRVEKLKDIDFQSMYSKGYSFFEEILFLLRKKGASFAEIPITFTDRRFGQSKINKAEAIRAIQIIAYLGWKNYWS